MRILLAGGTGAIVRSLVPMLVKDGHEVVVMTRDPKKVSALAEAMNAEPVVGDVFNELFVSCPPKPKARPD